MGQDIRVRMHTLWSAECHSYQRLNIHTDLRCAFKNLALRHASSGPQVAESLLIMLQLLSLGIAEMGCSKLVPFSRPVLMMMHR